MTLTHAQILGLRTASVPLMLWLEKNCHPHVQAIVHCTQVEILEGLGMARSLSSLADEAINEDACGLRKPDVTSGPDPDIRNDNIPF